MLPPWIVTGPLPLATYTPPPAHCRRYLPVSQMVPRSCPSCRSPRSRPRRRSRRWQCPSASATRSRPGRRPPERHRPANRCPGQPARHFEVRQNDVPAKDVQHAIAIHGRAGAGELPPGGGADNRRGRARPLDRDRAAGRVDHKVPREARPIRPTPNNGMARAGVNPMTSVRDRKAVRPALELNVVVATSLVSGQDGGTGYRPPLCP